MNLLEYIYENVDIDQGKTNYSYWLTQRRNTQKSYELQAQSFNNILERGETVIDYGSGMGLVKNYFTNFNYIDYEPYPQDRTPDFTDANALLKNYEGEAGGVVCNLVLNVIDSASERANVVKNILNLLRVGGVAYIVTRTPQQVETAKTKIPAGDGYKIKSGSGYTFQKGFTTSELKSYVSVVSNQLDGEYEINSGIGAGGNSTVKIERTY